jgi:hypothetical protein
MSVKLVNFCNVMSHRFTGFCFGAQSQQLEQRTKSFPLTPGTNIKVSRNYALRSSLLLVQSESWKKEALKLFLKVTSIVATDYKKQASIFWPFLRAGDAVLHKGTFVPFHGMKRRLDT